MHEEEKNKQSSYSCLHTNMQNHLNRPSSSHEKSKTKRFNYSCVHIKIKTNGVEAAGDENEKKVPPTENCERCNASFFRGGTFISASCPVPIIYKEKTGVEGRRVRPRRGK